MKNSRRDSSSPPEKLFGYAEGSTERLHRDYPARRYRADDSAGTHRYV